MFEFAKTVAIFCSPILVVVGWKNIDGQNNRRESRKEIYSLIVDMNKHIDELTNYGIDYLCAKESEKSKNLVHKIKRESKVLSVMFSNLKLLMSINNETIFTRYREALDSTFDSKEKKEFKADSAEVLRLHSQSSNLKSFILTEYYKKSPVKRKK